MYGAQQLILGAGLVAGADPEIYRWVGKASNVGHIGALARQTGRHRGRGRGMGSTPSHMRGGWGSGGRPRFFLNYPSKGNYRGNYSK